jgi:16S rRNA processing protein RimM
VSTPDLNSPPEDHVLIGRLGKTFQLEGGLRFYPLGDTEAKAIAQLKSVFVQGRGMTPVKRIRAVGSQTVLYLAGVITVEAAKPLVNRDLYAPVDDLPEPEEGAFYVELLLGLPVSVDGEPFGEVIDLVEAGGQDLLVVEADEEEVLVPLQADYVTVSGEGIAITDPPEGLFTLHQSE